MITDYIKQCSYTLGTLEPNLYLYPSDTNFLVSMDNNSSGEDSDSYITQISNNPTLLYCDSVTYTESSSIDKRFSFTDTLVARMYESKGTMHSDILANILSNSYYIGFKNLKGDLFILSTVTIPQVSYSYNLSSEGNYLEMTFQVSQDIPSMAVLNDNNTIQAYLNEKPCEYKAFGVKELYIADSDNVFIEGTNITYAEGSLKRIDFLTNKITLVKSMSNKNVTTTFNFSIPFEKYKNHLHYNILEFVNNVYTALIYTNLGTVIPLKNLFPSYTITTSEDYSSENMITITLQSSESLNNSSIGLGDFDEDDTNSTEGDGKYYSAMAYYDECINKTTKAHTLIQVLNFLQIPTNEYYCLEGYEVYYQNRFNIIGTYTEDETRFGFPITYESSDCQYWNCKKLQIDSTLYFYALGSRYCFPISQDTCNFTLSTVQGFKITQDETQLCIENISDESRTEYLNITYEDGTSQMVTLIVYAADDMLVRWVEDGTICSEEPLDGNSCQEWRDEAYDDSNPNTYVCLNGNKYKKQYLWISENCDSNYRKTQQWQQGDLIESDSDECLNQNCKETWELVEGEYICEASKNCEKYEEVAYNPNDSSTYRCQGTTKYSIKQLYVSENCDGKYVKQEGYYQIGDKIEENSPDCGYSPQPSGNTCEIKFEFRLETPMATKFVYRINNEVYEATESPVTFTINDFDFEKDTLTLINAFNASITQQAGQLLTRFNGITSGTKIRTNGLYGAFGNHKELTYVDLSGIDISSLNDISFMFVNCSNLQKVILDGWTKANSILPTIQNTTNTFYGCTNLGTISMKGCSTDIINQIKNLLFEAGLNLSYIDIITE